MNLDAFCCPACKGPLLLKSAILHCAACAKSFPIVDGIPDFFLAASDEEGIDQPNKTWLDPEIVAARDTVYTLSVRELKGMAFCMEEIGKRSGSGCRILEVGMGTGHFSRWLAEATRPGTEIYAFDYSWPIIEKAKGNVGSLSAVTLFRANARGPLPFPQESFDVVFLRLATLGAHGVPTAQAAYQMLRAEGWYCKAGWKPSRYETTVVEWAMQHGYESAVYHEWLYWRKQTIQERNAAQFELERMAAQGCRSAQRAQREERIRNAAGGTIEKMTYEHLLVAYKA